MSENNNADNELVLCLEEISSKPVIARIKYFKKEYHRTTVVFEVETR